MKQMLRNTRWYWHCSQSVVFYTQNRG